MEGSMSQSTSKPYSSAAGEWCQNSGMDPTSQDHKVTAQTDVPNGGFYESEHIQTIQLCGRDLPFRAALSSTSQLVIRDGVEAVDRLMCPSLKGK